jgi:hypothetical protein
MQYIGIKRGHMSWNATYNRIFMLKELLDNNFSGWAFYLDADSYISDMNFDLHAYLSDKHVYGGIFAGHLNNVSYAINAGGFAINFSHPAGRALVMDYYKQLSSIPPSQFDEAIFWEEKIPEDQLMLFVVLRDYHKNNYGDHFLFEKYGSSYVNTGPFIRQALRADFKSNDERVQFIKRNVQDVMERFTERPGSDGHTVAYLPALHPRLHSTIGVKTDFGIYTAGVDFGVLLYGPYINLESGSFRGELYLKIENLDSEIPKELLIQVTGEHTARTFAETRKIIDSVGYLTVYIPFDLDADTKDVEVRVVAPSGVKALVLALRIAKFS